MTGVVVVIGLVAAVAGLGATGRAINTPETIQPIVRSNPVNTIRPGPIATHSGFQRRTWTIGQAGLVGPSAWLTAPRETGDFAVRRAAIAAAYEAADMPAAAALAAAGWPTGKDTAQ